MKDALIDMARASKECFELIKDRIESEDLLKTYKDTCFDFQKSLETEFKISQGQMKAALESFHYTEANASKSRLSVEINNPKMRNYANRRQIFYKKK